MAMTGWYPDPGGMPGRYRYWDGSSWSAATTTDPADPAPTQNPRRARRSRRHAGVTALGVGTLVLVVVAVASVLIIRRAVEADAEGAGAAPTRVTERDDRGSTAGTAAAGTASQRCTQGHPDELAPHSQDGRVHGGRLSMTMVAGYSAPAPEYMLSWLDDTQSVSQTTEPGWQSLFAVGEVVRGAGFTSTRQTVHTSMTCAMANGWYLHPSSRTDIRDQAIDVDGRSGWILTAEIRDQNPRISVPGDQLTFVAVADGRTGTYSVWCGMVPLGDQQRIARDQQVLAGLRIDR